MVKDLTELIDFCVALVVAYDKSVEDGKFELKTDAPNFFQSLFLAPNALDGLNNIQSEWKELKSNDAARMELINRFKEKLDLVDDVKERDIEDAVEGIILSSTAFARLLKPTEVVVAEEEEKEEEVKEPVEV